MALNSFNVSFITDNTATVSTLHLDTLVSIVQTMGLDTYFDSTNEIGEVHVIYNHQDGWQSKKIIHDPITHQGYVKWSPYAHDGTWQKFLIKIFDFDGARTDIPRSYIGTLEDLTHLDGTTYLNI